MREDGDGPFLAGERAEEEIDRGQAAHADAFDEIIGHREERFHRFPFERLHDAPVEDDAVRAVAVRRILRQTVGEVAGCDDGNAPAQLFSAVRDDFSKHLVHVVIRKAGREEKDISFESGFLQEVHRDEHAPVDFNLPSEFLRCRLIHAEKRDDRLGFLHDRLGELLVDGKFHRNLGVPKIHEITCEVFLDENGRPARQAKIMRRHDDDRLRIRLHDELHGFPDRVHRLLDFLRFLPADFGNHDRRMRKKPRSRQKSFHTTPPFGE